TSPDATLNLKADDQGQVQVKDGETCTISEASLPQIGDGSQYTYAPSLIPSSVKVTGDTEVTVNNQVLSTLDAGNLRTLTFTNALSGQTDAYQGGLFDVAINCGTGYSWNTTLAANDSAALQAPQGATCTATLNTSNLPTLASGYVWYSHSLSASPNTASGDQFTVAAGANTAVITHDIGQNRVPSGNLSVINSMDDNRSADGVAQDTVTVLLLDAAGNPVINTQVTLTAGAGATLMSDTCITDAYGACTVGITATAPGSYAVGVIAPVQIGPVMVTFVGPVSQAHSTLFMLMNHQPANNVSENQAQVTLRDANGNPVEGQQVTLEVVPGATFVSNAQLSTVKRASLSGGPNPIPPSQQVTCTTDVQGTCTAGLTSPIPGSYEVSATAPVTLGPVTAVFTQPVPGAPEAGTSELAISVDGSPANGLSRDIAQVTLRDASGIPVPNVLVVFTVADSRATLVNATCLTDADGMCTVGLISTTGGQYEVGATVGTLTLSPALATFIDVCSPTVTTNCGSAAPDAVKSTIEVLAPNNLPAPNNTPADGQSQGIVRVTLRDANGLPVVNVLVTLQSGVGSTLTSTTCLTDMDGQCTVGVMSTTAGPYLIKVIDPITIGPVVAWFVAAPPPQEAMATPTLDPRVLAVLIALLAGVAVRNMRRGMC
ncbi:MAG: Ig-like domain-containing protein, partial [Rhodanobacter sp.]|nr:Ig-like domain-containing protein [Rhodanobacter sp.]